MSAPLTLEPSLVDLLRGTLHDVAGHTVTAVREEVPAYGEGMGEQMRLAGARARETEQQALRDARSGLDEAVKSIRLVVASARTRAQQNFWVAISAGVAAILAFMAGCTVPSAVDRAVPDHWHWRGGTV